MTKKHEWKSFSFIRHSCSLHFGRFILKILKILVFLVTRILILVILLIAFLTWSRAPIIIPSRVAPSTTWYFFQNTNAIKPITNKHEWKSVSFIRQSRSLHYGRFVLILFLFFRGN
jgi:hypothetical protein